MRFFALAAAIAVCSQPVAAHWQYTRWGMTPDQVISASKNTAHIASDPAMHGTAEARNLLDGKYRSQGFDFDINFLFDTSNKLSHVSLQLVTPADCPVLQGKLSNIYGSPKTSVTPIINLAKWWDKPHGNVLVLMQIGDDSCKLQYMKYEEAGAEGGL
ncbi:hypothetical protein [Hyphomicrobium sp. 2TAF46]|uniref:hypothetical protein n=1 Tax=Hyphomicrobium sp. 2TAF46 TaxID=3233019 RepID=UPI003F8DD4E7